MDHRAGKRDGVKSSREELVTHTLVEGLALLANSETYRT